jgi:hypothetical protein
MHACIPIVTEAGAPPKVVVFLSLLNDREALFAARNSEKSAPSSIHESKFDRKPTFENFDQRNLSLSNQL